MKKFAYSALLLAAVAFAAPALADNAPAASAPAVAPAVITQAASAVVKDFYVHLTDMMKQGGQLGYAGRFKKIDPAVEQAFNLPLMARMSVGPVWANATPAQQGQIVQAFSQFSVANYASRFASYDGEQFTVKGEKAVTGGKIVETTLTPKEGDAVTLNYLLKQDDKGQWRIVDVFLDGAISELATRRAEFSSVIQREGVAALVNSLSEKSKSMGPT